MVAPTASGFLRQRTVALLLLLVLTVYGVEAHGRRREKSAPGFLGDQSAYLAYARNLAERNYTVVEERNRMPVYPFLLSLIYRPGMTENEFLVRAQAFTVNLSIVLLVLLWFIFRRFFPPLHALGLLAATAFGVFLYRAGKAQVELLFYFVSFCSFLLLLRLFVRPTWWLALLAGAITGLAHLTKASVLPALALWVFIFLAHILWSFRARPWPQLGMFALALAAFFAVVFPYIRTSKAIYGSYFYNVNSTFVMWCDSSSEGFEFLKAYGNQAAWRSLPPDQLPSLQKYGREHSLAQIGQRIVHGSLDLLTQNARLIGYYKFVIALALAGAVLAVRQRGRMRELIAANPGAAIFCAAFFVSYFLLYAWYDAIVNDIRFVLSIYLPFLFAASVLVRRLGRDRTVSLAGRPIPFEHFFAGLYFSLALIDVIYEAPRLFR
jgi:hypothetical protein